MVPDPLQADGRDWWIAETDNGSRLVLMGSHIYPLNEPIRVVPASAYEKAREEVAALTEEVDRQTDAVDDANAEVARLSARVEELEALHPELSDDMIREIRELTDAHGAERIAFLDDAVRHALHLKLAEGARQERERIVDLLNTMGSFDGVIRHKLGDIREHPRRHPVFRRSAQ